jgi:hypothetical protein
MKLSMLKTSELNLEKLRLGLAVFTVGTILAGVAGGYLGWLALQEAGSKEAALKKRVLEMETRDASLAAARASAGSTNTRGIQAIRSFQEKFDRLAGVHQVKLTSFQSGTSLTAMKSSFGSTEAPRWGMVSADASLVGSSRSILSFLRDLPTIDAPFELEKAYFEPSLASPNGGTMVMVNLNIKLFAKEAKG